MISKKHQDRAIDLFNTYKTNKNNIDDGVNTEFLENKVNDLKNREFRLVVAGEVNAGKSTFINALLNERILPKDVLQASSRIVEISKSKEPYLKIQFADGKEELYNDIETSDRDGVNRRLHKLCSIREEYRDIPTPLIDSHIIDDNKNLVVDEKYVERLEQQTGESLQGKQNTIERYVQENSKSNIPVTIEYGYPLKWNFDGLRIVDTPGVNAMGGFQDVSFTYLTKANAILFVHSIKPIESESFMKFVKRIIPDHIKDVLFLVLTHAGEHTDDELKRLHAEAVRIYEGIIPENRILAVDSVLKLIHHDLHNGISPEEIEKSEDAVVILPRFQNEAKEQGRKLIDVVFEYSRFEKMSNILDEFSSEAPKLQIKEILEKIKSGYEQQEKLHNDRIQRLEMKKENPQKYSEEIHRLQKDRDKYKLRMNKTADDLKRDYSGKHSSWEKDIERLKDCCVGSIRQSNDKEILRKHVVAAVYSIDKKIDDFSKKLKQELGDVLEDVGRKFEYEYKITIPKIDLDYLEKQAKKGAFKEEKQYESYRPWWHYPLLLNYPLLLIFPIFDLEKKTRYTGTEKVFDDKKFLENLKMECTEKLTNMFSKLRSNCQEVLNQFLDSFKQEMKSVIDEGNKKLKEQEKKRQSNEDIRREIDTCNEKKTNILSEKSRCSALLGNII